VILGSSRRADLVGVPSPRLLARPSAGRRNQLLTGELPAERGLYEVYSVGETTA